MVLHRLSGLQTCKKGCIVEKKDAKEAAMGKFEKMLLLSDYDNTLRYTEEIGRAHV